jgi:hypothetical protein
LSPSKCDWMCMALSITPQHASFLFPGFFQPSRRAVGFVKPPRQERSSEPTMDAQLLDAGSLWPHVGKLVGGEQSGEHAENTKIRNHGTPHAT